MYLQEVCISHIPTAFQNSGNNYHAVVVKFAKPNSKGLTIVLIKNTKTCDAIVFLLSRMA